MVPLADQKGTRRGRDLPCCYEWQDFQSGHYALGIATSTHHVLGYRAARERGKTIWLDRYESRSYDVMLRFSMAGGRNRQRGGWHQNERPPTERWVPPSVRPISGSRRPGAMNGQVVAPRRVEIDQESLP
jgi:Domain of unknown function (DUF4432)